MAAQRFKDILFSYVGLISSNDEINQIRSYFHEVQDAIAEADFSEIISISATSIHRDPVRIKEILADRNDHPFVFISCLN